MSAGTWKTNSRGIWTVDGTRSNISNFEITISAADGAFNVTMNCEDDTTDNDGYILLKYVFNCNQTILEEVYNLMSKV